MFKVVIFCTALNAFGQQVLPSDFDDRQQCLANSIDYDGAMLFAKKMQIALRNNDKNAIVDLADYPLKINKGFGEKVIHYYIKDRQQFLQEYRSIMTVEVKKTILNAVPTDVICNYQGGAIAGGTIWFYTQPPSTPVKFTVVNVDY